MSFNDNAPLEMVANPQPDHPVDPTRPEGQGLRLGLEQGAQ
jgi:hypothetical protein